MCFETNIPSADFRDSSILLVEDDDEEILSLKRAFRNARISNPLSVVKDGEEAIKFLSGDGARGDRSRYPIPFLILLDLRLPKLSGFEMLAWIREQPELAGLIIVVLTASDQVRDVTQAHELGANSYFVKPGTFDDLVESVKGIQGRWLPPGRPSADLDPSETSGAVNP